ncbi:SKAP1 protein, partial [Polyodon spathula]|nr:SKAP1 protein [Polyodon spathula]
MKQTGSLRKGTLHADVAVCYFIGSRTLIMQFVSLNPGQSVSSLGPGSAQIFVWYLNMSVGSELSSVHMYSVESALSYCSFYVCAVIVSVRVAARVSFQANRAGPSSPDTLLLASWQSILYSEPASDLSKWSKTLLYLVRGDCNPAVASDLTAECLLFALSLRSEYNIHGWWVGELNGSIGIVPKDFLATAYIL